MGLLGRKKREETEPLLGAAEDHGGLSLWSASFVLANACIGSGVLSFPYNYSKVGVLLGTGVFIVFAALLGFSLHVIARSLETAQRTHGPSVRSYEALVEIVGGPKLALFMEVTMTLYLFGACVAYEIIIADTALPLAVVLFGVNEWISDPAVLTLLVSACVLLPLALQRSVRAFRCLSFFAVASVGYMVVVIIGECLATLPPREPVPLARGGANLFSVFPVFAYALGCHLNCALVYSEIKSEVRSPASFTFVITTAYGIASAFYVPTGVCGFIQFGSGTPQDILAIPDPNLAGAGTAGAASLGYAPEDKWALVARLGTLFNSAMCFTLTFMPARSMLWSLARKCLGREREGVSGGGGGRGGGGETGGAQAALATGSVNSDSNDDKSSSISGRTPAREGAAEPDDHEPGERQPWQFVAGAALGWIGTAALIAMQCRQLSIVFQLLGAIFGAFEVFIYPSLFWYTFHDGKPLSWYRAGPAAGLLAMGLVLMVMGTTTTIIGMK